MICALFIHKSKFNNYKIVKNTSSIKQNNCTTSCTQNEAERAEDFDWKVWRMRRRFASVFFEGGPGKRPWICGLHFRWRKLLARAKHVQWTVEFAGKLLLIRRLRKQSDRCWPFVGHKITFSCHSQTNLRISRGTGSLRVTFQRLSRLFLKTFEDASTKKNNLYKCPRTYFT